jgi:hypothetical protein
LNHFTPINFIENLIALLFSFNYGLFFFSPILLLSIFSVVRIVRKKKPSNEEKTAKALLPTLALYLVFVGSWWMWNGGRSLNARLLIEAVPVIVILLNHSYLLFRKSLIYKAAFYLAFIISLLINILTTYCIDPTLSWYDHFTIHDPHHSILTHKYQIRNAWYYRPTVFVYIFRNFMKTKTINVSLFYRKDNKLILKTDVLRPSLKHLNITKLSENEVQILQL